ncbi:phage tail protein [Streptomyces sp. NPDC005078]|uniref:phage tail protein n=1 Tax=unclassified Streptomyces TaxID=2593676 RepID=UPI0033A0F58B
MPGYPLQAFNFSVSITPDGDPAPLCDAAFAECDGLEMSLDVKTIREGGNNGVQIKLTGATSYGQLTLKRGMTKGFDLWRWFERVAHDPRVRATGEIVLRAADRDSDEAVFVLGRCVPLKIKAPSLNAREGIVAVEEMQLGYESLSLRAAEGDGSHV